jgi:hypothetical protein
MLGAGAYRMFGIEATTTEAGCGAGGISRPSPAEDF